MYDYDVLNALRRSDNIYFKENVSKPLYQHLIEIPLPLFTLTKKRLEPLVSRRFLLYNLMELVIPLLFIIFFGAFLIGIFY